MTSVHPSVRNLTFQQRLAGLSTPIPSSLVKKLVDNDYIEWTTARAVLDFWFMGYWESSFKYSSVKLCEREIDKAPVAQLLYTGVTTITVYDPTDLTISISHDGIGQAETLLWSNVKGKWIYQDNAPTTAESHSFKRAAVKFGIAIELYNERRDPMTEHLTGIAPLLDTYQEATMLTDTLVKEGKISVTDAQAASAFFRSCLADPGSGAKLETALANLKRKE